MESMENNDQRCEQTVDHNKHSQLIIAQSTSARTNGSKVGGDFLIG